MENELDRLRALKPKKPPTKQRKVDLWLNEIEQKQKEDGATLDEISHVLFPELKPATFRVMLRRARKKRERNSQPASPEKQQSLTKRSRKQQADTPTVKTGSGRGNVLNEEQSAICKDNHGSTLQPQDSRIPPPWSDEPVTEKELLGDLPNRGILVQCETWLEIHFYLSVFNDPKDIFMGGEPDNITLKALFRKRYPDDEDRAKAIRKK